MSSVEPQITTSTRANKTAITLTPFQWKQVALVLERADKVNESRQLMRRVQEQETAATTLTYDFIPHVRTNVLNAMKYLGIKAQ